MATLSDSSRREEERPESTEQPVAQRQIRCPLASTAQDDQLLLEHEILCDHRSHAIGATQLRGHDSKMEQGEQEVLHARVSVGQTPGATVQLRATLASSTLMQAYIVARSSIGDRQDLSFLLDHPRNAGHVDNARRRCRRAGREFQE